MRALLASRAWLNDYALKPLLNLGLRVLHADVCEVTTTRVDVYEKAYFFWVYAKKNQLLELMVACFRNFVARHKH